MSTPERKNDRYSLSRPSPEQQQQSPFRRAQRDRPLSYTFDTSRFDSPSSRDSAQRRRHFSQTQTLKGAFEATSSRVQRMSETTNARGTPSPKRRGLDTLPFSPESNPPDELNEIYQRIGDDQALADYEPEEDFQATTDQARDSRRRRFSSGSGKLSGNASQEGVFVADDAVLNDFSDDRLTEHLQDELRLRRATTNHSPVLNRTNSAAYSALTAENLQRRNEEAQQTSEEEDGLNPRLNLPTTWGSRATQNRNWLRDIGRRNEPEQPQAEKEPTRVSPARSNTGKDLSNRLARASDRSPGRAHMTGRSALEERSTSGYNRALPVESQKSSPEQKRPEGNEIPNTPITVYQNSTFNKRSPTKRDSHSLLRKLSRTESPSQMKTPETQKAPPPHIYDKTPIVTGAWIDTPVTERTERVTDIPEMPEDLTRDIIPHRSERPPVIPEESSQPEELQQTEPRPSKVQFKEPEPPKPQNSEPRPSEAQPKESRIAKPIPELPPPKTQKKPKPPLEKPNLPKSALDMFMQNIQTDKDSYDMGDDTIESLQVMLEEQPTEGNAETDDAAYEEEILKKLQTAKSQGKGPTTSGQLSDELFNGLDDRLVSLVQKIRSIEKGLDGLEDHVTRDTALFSSQSKSKHIHTGDNCETCGTSSDGRLYAPIPLPLLWKRDPISQRIRPTWLGWCTVIFLIWFFSESTMCDYYCHPSISNVCKGNCLRPDAPQFPFVIPTMLWRWLRLSTVVTPLITMMIAFSRLIAQLLGFWDGYVDEVPRAVNLSGEILVNGNRVLRYPAAGASSKSFPVPDTQWNAQKVHQESVPELNLGREAVGDEPSMDDDEYL